MFFFIANSTSNSILNCQSCYCSGIVCFLLSTLLQFNVQRTKIMKNAYEFHPLLISLWFLLLPAVFFLLNYIFTHIPSDWTVLITLTPCCIWKTLCRAQFFLIVNFFPVSLVVTSLNSHFVIDCYVLTASCWSSSGDGEDLLSCVTQHTIEGRVLYTICSNANSVLNIPPSSEVHDTPVTSNHGVANS